MSDVKRKRKIKKKDVGGVKSVDRWMLFVVLLGSTALSWWFWMMKQ